MARRSIFHDAPPPLGFGRGGDSPAAAPAPAAVPSAPTPAPQLEDEETFYSEPLDDDEEDTAWSQ